MQFVIMAVGVLAILLAVLAQWLGIDNNPVWGTGRILLLIFGLAFLGFAALLYFWKTERISDNFQHKIIGVGQKTRNALSWSFHWLSACQPLSLAISIFVVILISAYAIWYTSLGRFTIFSPVTNTYVDQGEAFLHGQLSLLQQPDPRLVALQNPYDSKQRKSIPFIWDSSLYKGKFYLYWGPAPALIFALTEWIFRSRPPDQLVVLISYIGLAVILGVLLFQIRKRYFPNAPGISIAFFILAASISAPFLFILGRPQIYETSIIAGQFFLILGVLAWYFYQISSKLLWLALAGLSWGLAIASRYNLAVSIAAFSVFALISIYQKKNVNDRILPGNKMLFNRIRCIDWKAILALFIPIALCGIALGIYNYMRFGNPLETGFTYQLTETQPLNHFYSISYIPSNFFMYLAYPIHPVGTFPFFKSVSIQFNLLPGWAGRPSGKMFDQVFLGIFPSLPVLWSMALLVPLTVIGFIKGQKEKYFNQDAPSTKQLRQIVAMFFLSGLLQFIFLLLYFYGAMRYVIDFYLPLALVAFITIWAFDNVIRHIPVLRWLFWLIIVGLTITTVGIGFFAGFDIPPQYFRLWNPQLFGWLFTFWNHQYNQMISLLGEPQAFAGTLSRISARIVVKFSR